MESSSHIINEEVNLLSMAYELSNSMNGQLAAARGYVLTGNTNDKNTFASYSQQSLEIQQSFQQYEAFKDIEKTIIDATEWNTTIQQEVFPLYDQGNIDGAIAMLTSLDARSNAIYNEYKTFAQTKNTEIKDRGNNLANDMDSTKTILLILSYTITTVALVLAFYLSNNISKPITRLMNRIESISNRELNHEPLKITSKDEIARLTVATNAMNDQLKDIVTNIQDGASAVTQSSNNLKVAAHIVTRSLVEGYEEVEKGSKQTHISSETYRNISVAVTEMVSNIKSVTQNLQHIANNTSDIDNAIKNIAAISEQSAASSQQTAATIQEVASSMESVAQNAEQLNGTADKLQDVVQQFKL